LREGMKRWYLAADRTGSKRKEVGLRVLD